MTTGVPALQSQEGQPAQLSPLKAILKRTSHLNTNKKNWNHRKRSKNEREKTKFGEIIPEKDSIHFPKFLQKK